MSYLFGFEISLSGMAVEKARLDVAAMNIANANSSVAPGTEGYRAKSVISGPVYGEVFERVASAALHGVEVKYLGPSSQPYRKVFDAVHPHADEQGYVTYPNVQPAAEMLNTMKALRAYEANVQAANAARVMAKAALEIGGTR